MDKDNKYYGLIGDLVKKHKKYPGHEAILEDIIDDVYKHAEVVIKSINNESVIKSFLEKTISTSIITVPKMLNFHKEIPHRTINSQTIETPTEDTQNEIGYTQHSEERASNELVDKMINSSFEEMVPTDDIDDNILDEIVVEENSVSSIEETPNEVAEISEDVSDIAKQDEYTDLGQVNVNVIENDEKTSIDAIEDIEVSDVSVSDVVEISDNNTLTNNVEENSFELDAVDTQNEPDAIEEYVENTEIHNLELVDSSYENEIQPDVINDSSEALELTEPEISEDFDSVPAIDDVEILETLPENDASNDDITEDNNSEIQGTDEIQEIANVDALETISETVAYDDNITEESNIDIQEFDETLMSAEDTLITDNTDIDLSTEFSAVDTLLPFDEEQNIQELQEDFSAESSELEYVEPIEAIETGSEIASDNSKPEFRYAPSSPADSIDADALVENILKLNNNYPNLKILKVYELKYKNKYTLEQVSSELNMTTEDVLKALDKLVSLI